MAFKIVLFLVVFFVVCVVQSFTNVIKSNEVFNNFGRILNDVPEEGKNEFIRQSILKGYYENELAARRPPPLGDICFPPPIGCFDPNDPSVRPRDPCRHRFSETEFDNMSRGIYHYYKESLQTRQANPNNIICFPAPIGCRDFNEKVTLQHPHPPEPRCH